MFETAAENGRLRLAEGDLTSYGFAVVEAARLERLRPPGGPRMGDACPGLGQYDEVIPEQGGRPSGIRLGVPSASLRVKESASTV